MKRMYLLVGLASLMIGCMNASAKTFDPNFKLVNDVIAPAIVETVDAVTAKTTHRVDEDCYPIDQYIPSNIDMAKVRQNWLDMNNKLRKGAGLTPYKLNLELDWTALNWSDRAKRLGSISHKRDGSNAYYDYNKILGWFKNLGLTFKSVHGSTMTENIGWGVYKCPADGSDCTAAINTAVKTTFDFFVKEKASNGAHWRSLMDKDYTEIGLGLALDKTKHKYYLTIHYATAINSNPKPICQAS